MPELARNRRTGTVHVAAELPFSPELDTGGWECPGCRVEMMPVAASGAQHYKVAPHFRVHGDHANNCNALGESPGGATALSTAEDIDDEPPDTFPRALRLAVNRTDGTGDQPAALTPANAGTPKATGAHLAQGSSGIAGTLHRIAEAYLLAPQHHGQPLQIDGCEGTTYETCFRRLKNASQAARLPRLIWFAEIQFRHIVRDGDTAEVTLSPLLWMRERAIVRPGPHYRTRFDMGTWNERRRSAMLAELDRRRAEQRELHHTEAEERLTMFFFGRQDHDDPMLFHVEDPRLVCFFRMPKA